MPFSITLHPATVHFPIALLSLASICGLLYIYWRPLQQLLVLTWWPMRIGWIGGAVGVGTGLLSQSGLPPQPIYSRLLNWHIGTALMALVLYGLLLYWRWLCRDGRTGTKKKEVAFANDQDLLLADRSKQIWVTLLLVGGLIILLLSGWSGGRLVYTWGVNVP